MPDAGSLSLRQRAALWLFTRAVKEAVDNPRYERGALIDEMKAHRAHGRAQKRLFARWGNLDEVTRAAALYRVERSLERGGHFSIDSMREAFIPLSVAALNDKSVHLRELAAFLVTRVARDTDMVDEYLPRNDKGVQEMVRSGRRQATGPARRFADLLDTYEEQRAEARRLQSVRYELHQSLESEGLIKPFSRLGRETDRTAVHSGLNVLALDARLNGAEMPEDQVVQAAVYLRQVVRGLESPELLSDFQKAAMANGLSSALHRMVRAVDEGGRARGELVKDRHFVDRVHALTAVATFGGDEEVMATLDTITAEYPEAYEVAMRELNQVGRLPGQFGENARTVKGYLETSPKLWATTAQDGPNLT